MIQKKNLTVTIKNTPDISLTGSRIMLYRVMSNLLENAAKYNREHGSVTVVTGRDGDAVAVEITDTGLESRKKSFPIFSSRFTEWTSRGPAPWEAQVWDCRLLRILWRSMEERLR